MEVKIPRLDWKQRQELKEWELDLYLEALPIRTIHFTRRTLEEQRIVEDYEHARRLLDWAYGE